MDSFLFHTQHNSLLFLPKKISRFAEIWSPLWHHYQGADLVHSYNKHNHEPFKVPINPCLPDHWMSPFLYHHNGIQDHIYKGITWLTSIILDCGRQKKASETVTWRLYRQNHRYDVTLMECEEIRKSFHMHVHMTAYFAAFVCQN